jgi:hypothetical protein
MKKIKNFALALCLVMLAINSAQAAAPTGTARSSSTLMQGGSNSSSVWKTPAANAYKVFVQVLNGTATNARYRVYPKGKSPTSTTCSSTDASYPCYQILVNQAVNQNKWVQLTVNNNLATKWTFNTAGFVAVYANTSKTTEWVSTAQVVFQPITAPVVYPTTGYSKISNSGALLADSAVFGTGATNWACTRDNETGLIWEVKTDDGGLRDKDNTYSWYNPNSATNGGLAGYQNNGICAGGISCDTNGYVKAVNTQKLCGFSDWKVPNISQLLSLINARDQITYFLSSLLSNEFWSSSPYTDSNEYANLMDFEHIYGSYIGYSHKSSGRSALLVRGGQ